MLKIILKGGPGSGNFGHAGRPGKRGGSASGTGGIALATASDRKWLSSLSTGERTALNHYLQIGPPEGGSAHINSALRTGDVDSSTMSRIHVLDSAIAKAPQTTRTMTFYRGLPAGSSVGDGAFISAGRSASTAGTYTSGGRVLVKFTVPRGTPVASISMLQMPDIAEEVLLPRSTVILSEEIVSQ